jgi:biotin operon repressor
MIKRKRRIYTSFSTKKGTSSSGQEPAEELGKASGEVLSEAPG